MNNLQQGKKNCIFAFHYYHYYAKKYIETPRLILRDWKEEDIPFFARMNADPNVMEFFLSSLSSEESFAFLSAYSK